MYNQKPEGCQSIMKHIDKYEHIVLLPKEPDYNDWRRWEWPDIVPHPDYRKAYVNMRDITYRMVIYVEGEKFWLKLHIPRLFQHDGRTGPLDRDGPWRIPAHIHDAIGRSGGFTRSEIPVTLDASYEPVGDYFPVTISNYAGDCVYRDIRTQIRPEDRIMANMEFIVLRTIGRRYFGKDMKLK